MVESFEAGSATATDSAAQTMVHEAYRQDSDKKPAQADSKSDDKAKVDQTFGKVEIVEERAEKAPLVEQQTSERPIDKEACGKAADAIDKACHFFGNDNETIFKALEGKSQGELDEIKKQFADKHNGKSLVEFLKEEMHRHPEELNKALALLGEQPVKPAADTNKSDKNDQSTKDAGVSAAKSADDSSAAAGAGAGSSPAKKAETVDSEKVQKGAESIHDAMHGLWRSDSDYEKVNKILHGMNDKEREALTKQYHDKYGIDLSAEFKDHDKDAQQDKALNLLNKKDADGDDAGRVHTTLIERHQWIEGRSDANCEKDIRDTISTMNSEQIAQLDKNYCDRYGKHLHEALMDDDKLSQKSKDALEIYLKGTDKRTDDDTLKLADMAIKNKDIEMFGEAMRNASPEARKKFTDDGGEQKLKDAFEGHWYNALSLVGGNVTDKELHRAEDFAKEGHMSTANKIRENTGVVSNTDKGIEQAINDMTPAERAAYSRGKELSKSGTDTSKLSEDDQKALKTYNDIHKALVDTQPVDMFKIDKWEDMIEHKGGSLAGRITSHKGHLYNDSASDATKEIENMSKSDWDYAKAHPQEARDQALKALQDLKGASISQEDIDRGMKLYDQKMAAKTYEESQNVGHRALIDKLDGDTHWYKNDRKSMVEDITHMTNEEQDKYRNDPEYRKKLDDMLKDKLGEGPALDAARHLLEKVRNGEKPEADLIVKMNMRAQEENESKNLKTAGAIAAGSLIPGAGTAIAAGAIADRSLNDGNGQTATSDALFGSHSANAVRDMQDEFQKHPELRERILHPKTEEDKKLATDFEKAARQAMGDTDYDKYAKPLLETGHLPIDVQMQLNKGAITNDKDGSYKDILNASPEEKQKILHDKAYQDNVLGYLSDDDRKVALNVLEQGKEQPEDKIRAKLNHWGGSDDIMQTLRGMKGNPAAVEKMKEEYARKYGHDLTADLIDKLSGSDKLEAENILKRQPQSGREAFNDARDQYYQSYDGAGKAFVNGVWDGTGHMSEDALNDFASKMEQFSAKFKELPPEQQKELSEKLNKSIDLLIESKGAAAGAVVDTIIAVAAVAGAVFTDGVSLGLLAATGAGGAALKVLVNSVLMGSDYDWSAKGVGKDAVIGFVDGFVSMLGPGEVGSLLKVGETAAKAATEQALKQGAEQLIKKGGQELLEKEMQNAVKNAIVHGSYEVSDKALTKMVEQVAKEGATDAEKAALKQSLKTALEESLSKETKSTLQKLATEYGFNMLGGAMGGASANTAGALMEWDSSKSVGDNMANVGKAAAMGAVFGAGGAAAFTTVFKVGGSMYHGIKESFHLKPGEQLSPEQLQKLAQETGIKDAKLHYDDQGNLVLEGHPDRPAMLPPEPKGSLDPHGDPIPGANDLPKDRPVHVDPHGDTIPPTERPQVPERIAKDELLKQTPELNQLSDAEKAIALERAAKDPLYKPETIDDFNGRVNKLTASSEWKGLSAEEKTAQLQKMLDKFADDNGLVRSKLELSQSGEGIGGSYGDGKIEISKAALDDPSALVERLYHENVHAQQDKLVISNLADELKIGKQATPDQISQIKAEYAKRTNGELSDQHLKDILVQRDGKQLSSEDALRAKNAESAFKNDPARSGQLERVDAEFKAVNKELQPFLKSDSGDASQMLLKKMADDPAYARKVFGGDPPAEVQRLIDIEKRIQKGENISFPKEEADKVLRSQLTERNNKLGAERAQLLKDYFNNGNENEAYLIGRKAKLQAESPAPAQHSGTNPGIGSPDRGGTDPMFGRQNGEGRDTIPALEQPAHTDDSPPTLRNPEDAPNTVRIPKEVSPEVQYVLDSADIPPQERAAVLDRIRQNELAKPEAMHDFLRDGKEMGSRWQDLSKVASDAQSGEQAMQQAQRRFFHDVHDQIVDDLVKRGMNETDAILLANNPKKLQDLAHSDSSVGKFFKENPEKLPIVDQLVHAQDVQNTYNKAVQERTADLQKMIDKFNKEHNLPHTEVRLVGARELNGANGDYQNGVIRMNADQVLARQDMTALLETLYHENIHSQQDSLIIRKAADQFEAKMGAGYKLHEPPTKAELDGIMSLYRDERISPITEQHLKDVLSVRNGEKLTPEQVKLAEALSRDWKAEGLGNYNQYSNDVAKSVGRLKELNSLNGTKNMMDALANDQSGVLAHELFGTNPADNNIARQPIDIQRLVADYKAGRITEAAAHDILETAIVKNIDHMNVVRAALRKQYMQGVHETEAWVIGQTLQNEGRKGSAAVAPDMVSPETTTLDGQPTPADSRTTRPLGSVRQNDAPTGANDSQNGAVDQADSSRDTLPQGSMYAAARPEDNIRYLDFDNIFDTLLNDGGLRSA